MLKAEKAGYESVTTDGIHLTEYGNEIIAGAWLQLFEKIKDGNVLLVGIGEATTTAAKPSGVGR